MPKKEQSIVDPLSHESRSLEVLRSWRENPVKFVEEVIFAGAPEGWQISSQQREGLAILGEMIRAKIKAGKGEELTEEERVLAVKLGISIRSGHGTGKDAFLSWVYFYLLVCFYMGRGMVTAPTAHQLDAILWGEFRKWHRMSPLLQELVEVKAEKVYLKVAKGEAFIEGRTANVKATADEQAETLAGRHADYMILAADEASGIPAPVFQPLEGAMTGLMNMAILIGNMTRSSGYFYDSHFTALKNRFVTLHWSSEESELVNKFTLKEEEKTYGRDSNWYRVRRLGEPPIAGEDVLIPYEWVMDAVDREIEQEDKEAALIYGIDVADEMGESKSIICQRRGCKVETLFERQTSDTMALSGWASTFIEEEKPDAVGIDSIGVGAGVFHRLRELGHRVNGIKVSRTPSNKEKFFRLRDELYWRMRERFEDGTISIPKDDELIGQLASIRIKDPSSQGQIKIESKSDMRKRGLKSPDKADALALTFYFPEKALRMRKKAAIGRPPELAPSQNKRSWMTA